MSVERVSYEIMNDESCHKPAKLSEAFSYTVDDNEILIENGTRVNIRGGDAVQEQLQVSFQLACRYVDDWNNHVRLTKKLTEQFSYEEATVDINLSQKAKGLECWHETFFHLDFDVLLFLHRASDFINIYAETALINALFALEVEVNLLYESIRVDKPTLPESEKIPLQNKVCNVVKRANLSEDDYWILLGLVELRNKLAHAEWYKVITADVDSCDDKNPRQSKPLNLVLQLIPDDFTEAKKQAFRINHATGRKLVNKTIDIIMKLQPNLFEKKN